MNRRRIVGAIAATVVTTTATLLLASSAQAATTVNAQLAFSGVVTAKAPTGGSVVGVHPGDTVDLKAATVPTAGLDALGLGNLANNLLSGLAGYQVVVHLPANFPGGKRDVTLGACPGNTTHLPLTFSAKGTYDFTFNAYRLQLACLLPASLSGTDLNQLKAAGVAINAQQRWVGQVVVADDPPAGGISVQLPGVSASPSLPVAGQLPGVGLPGVTTPTLPNVLDPGTLTGVLPGGGSTTPGGGSHPPGTSGSGPTLNYTPPGQSLGDLTVPHGYGSGSGAAGNYVAPGLSNSLVAPGTNFVTTQNGTAGKPATATAGAPKSVDVASTRSRSALDALPTLLVVLAVIALSGATAFYARTFLLHKPAAAKVESA